MTEKLALPPVGRIRLYPNGSTSVVFGEKNFPNATPETASEGEFVMMEKIFKNPYLMQFLAMHVAYWDRPKHRSSGLSDVPNDPAGRDYLLSRMRPQERKELDIALEAAMSEFFHLLERENGKRLETKPTFGRPDLEFQRMGTF